MSAELPPPYSALTRHPMLARASHDETARFNFLTHLNRYLSGTLGPGNKLTYETRALPAFRAEHGRDPEHRYEVRMAMMRDPFHRMWSALKRNSMEMRQQNGRQVVLRQLDELDAQARQFNEHSGQLELDPKVEQPWYQTAVDIHCQPGGYHSEERPGDVTAGANYDVGIFATTGGALGGLIAGQAEGRGLDAFFRLGWADGRFHEVERFASAGLRWREPIKGRREDQAGIGVVWSGSSARARRVLAMGGEEIANNDWAFEATYSLAIAKWLTLQPSVQYFLNPAYERGRKALMGGLRITTSWSF